MDQEELYIDALKKAQEAGVRVMAGSRSSRANSISMTNLETAQLWAEQDRKEKTERDAKASK